MDVLLPPRPRVALLWIALVGGAVGCGAMPPGRVERALYNDLRTVVEMQERTEWVVERSALDNMAPQLLLSTCQAAPEARQRLAAWLDGRVAALGGPAEQAYLADGHDLSSVSGLLTLERVKAALVYADTRVAAECPFWLEPDPEFDGVQSNARRFVLLLESRGQGAVHVSGANVGLGGGGGGRVLPAVGLSDRLTLATGIGLGGAGRFEQGKSITAAFSAAVPLVVRIQDASRIYDFEVAAVTYLDRDEILPPGVRGAVSIGLATPRVGLLGPYAVLWLGYEYHPPRAGDPSLHIIGLGTRVGLSLDP